MGDFMKNIQTLMAGALSACLLAGLGGPSFASTPALSVTGPTVYPNNDNQDWSLGWEFDVSSPITVTALGYNNYGFSSNHDVALYTSGGSELGSVVVTGTSMLVDGYRYTPISLSLGVGDYVITGTTLGLNDGWTYQATSWTTIPEVSYTGSWFTSGNGGNPNFPTTFASGRQYFEVNFLVPGGIPEPSTWAMMALGFAGLGIAGGRRTTGRSAVVGA
jgi:hypothetical protein